MPGIGGGWPLDVLMLQVAKIGRLGSAAGYVWQGSEPFYGTRVGPGWYQSGTRVARGCKLPFSVLRMLMQPSRKRLGREGRTQQGQGSLVGT